MSTAILSTSSATSDDQLIEAARQGNRDAYGELVQKYGDRLFAGLMQRTQAAADAEDVAQEAFVQAYLKLDSFRGNSGFFTWLFRIALNLLATRRRRKNRETPFADAPPAACEQTMDAAQSPGACLLRKEQRSLVQAALRRLSDEHRTVLVLREYEGFDYETIAEMLNTKAGTVRSRVFRARHALKSEMEAFGSSA